LVLINLLIDGATNAFEDRIFSVYRVKSCQLMFFINLFSGMLMLLYLLTPLTDELMNALVFMNHYPTVWTDILKFCICGSMGQIFIFLTLETFGSLSLVMVTVTRKMFTVLLSLFWFDHHLNLLQWGAMGIVFVALMIEAYHDYQSKKPKKKSRNFSF